MGFGLVETQMSGSETVLTNDDVVPSAIRVIGKNDQGLEKVIF